jgi:hypothetical protein
MAVPIVFLSVIAVPHHQDDIGRPDVTLDRHIAKERAPLTLGNRALICINAPGGGVFRTR